MDIDELMQRDPCVLEAEMRWIKQGQINNDELNSFLISHAASPVVFEGVCKDPEHTLKIPMEQFTGITSIQSSHAFSLHLNGQMICEEYNRFGLIHMNLISVFGCSFGLHVSQDVSVVLVGERDGQTFKVCGGKFDAKTDAEYERLQESQPCHIVVVDTPLVSRTPR